MITLTYRIEKQHNKQGTIYFYLCTGAIMNSTAITTGGNLLAANKGSTDYSRGPSKLFPSLVCSPWIY